MLFLVYCGWKKQAVFVYLRVRCSCKFSHDTEDILTSATIAPKLKAGMLSIHRIYMNRCVDLEWEMAMVKMHGFHAPFFIFQAGLHAITYNIYISYVMYTTVSILVLD